MTKIFSSSRSNTSAWLRTEHPIFFRFAFGTALFLLAFGLVRSLVFWRYASAEITVFNTLSTVVFVVLGVPLTLVFFRVFRLNQSIHLSVRAQKTYLQSMLDVSGLYVVRMDVEGNYTYANRTFLEAFVREEDRDTIIGTFSLKFVIPEDHDIVIKAVEKCFAEPETPMRVTLRKPSLQFGILTTTWDFVEIRNTYNDVLEIQCTGIDLTERIRNEGELHIREAHLRTVVDNSPQSIWLIDRDLRVLTFNKLTQESVYRALQKQIVVGESIASYLMPDRAAKFIGEIRQAFSGAAVEYEAPAMVEGKECWFRYSIKPVYADDTRVVAVLMAALDITIAKRSEIIIHKQNQLLDTTGAIARIGGWEFDMVHGRIRWTKEIYRIYDVSEDTDLSTVTGEFQFFHPEHRPIIQAASQQLLTTGEPFDLELKLITATDKHLWVRAAGRCVRGESGSIEQLYGILQDITVMKEAQEEILQLNKVLEHRVEERTKQLVELNREKDEFLGIAAHDLKNPLAGIRSGAEIIESMFTTGDDAERVHRFTGMMMNACDAMVDIIANILDVNRIESGLVSVDIQPVDMEIVASVVEEYQARATQKGIILHLQALQNLTAHADKQALRQILDNLVSNAVKYSPQWKQVWVRCLSRTENGKEYVRVEVQDEGPGLTAEDQQYVFGKFARLSAQPTGGENSTGLGLSIVKRLVELQEGRVWCESEPGKGATFILELQSAEA